MGIPVIRQCWSRRRRKRDIRKKNQFYSTELKGIAIRMIKKNAKESEWLGKKESIRDTKGNKLKSKHTLKKYIIKSNKKEKKTNKNTVTGKNKETPLMFSWKWNKN